MSRKTVLEAHDLVKTYVHREEAGNGGTHALDHVNLSVAEGDFLGIMGPSGSGKSTLLNCLSTIDKPTSGSVRIGTADIGSFNASQLACFRREQLGFVFQDSNLLDTLTCYENIALALTIKKTPAREIEPRVRRTAKLLSIEDVLDQYPYQVSGGQAQRVACARATVGSPHLVLADEPTGALDSRAAAQLMQTFDLLNRMGSSILMVTHDPVSASWCSRIVFIRDGRLWGQIERGDKVRETFYADIIEVVAKLGEGGADAR